LTSQTRTFGEIGFDAVLRGSGTFAYKNEAWNIDGLRHLVTPRISYRYIQADKKGLVPEIDRPAFSTYLQPLGLSDTRAVDTLRGSNTLRLALENVLQTRDPVYGSRDLAALTVANDFGFKPGRRDLSGLQLQAALMPASWLQFDTYQRYTPRHLALDEFNTGFTVHDGRQWSVGFSNNFLRHQLNVYAVEAHVRLNEAYDFFTRLNYDARKHRFNEQAYGVTQNLGNTWLISYLVSLYSGPRRESHFGFSVQVDTVRF
jgi:LPS-assembly protein